MVVDFNRLALGDGAGAAPLVVNPDANAVKIEAKEPITLSTLRVQIEEKRPTYISITMSRDWEAGRHGQQMHSSSSGEAPRLDHKFSYHLWLLKILRNNAKFTNLTPLKN